MLDFMERVRQENVQKITLNSEPNVESFYLKLEFKMVGKLATSIPGRYMPVMELILNELILNFEWMENSRRENS